MSLYPLPQILKTEVFTKLPEAFADLDRRSDWIDANKPGAKMASFLEGPTFDPDGNLYVTDIPHGRIFCISPSGGWSLVSEYDGWPNGLVLHPDGHMLIADYRRGILSLDVHTGAVSPYLIHVASEGFKGVNDLTFDRQGRLYFTDQGQTGMHNPTGRVYRFDPKTDRLECLLDKCPSPNGLVLNPEESTLYVAMTRGNAIWRVPIREDGLIAKVGVFAQMAGGVSGADGMAVDQSGNLFVADAGNGCVWSFTKWAEPLYRIKACTSGRTTTNVAFGGVEGKTLFITESETGHILSCSLEIPGRTLLG